MVSREMDGVLHGVPFGVCLDSDGGGHSVTGCYTQLNMLFSHTFYTHSLIFTSTKSIYTGLLALPYPLSRFFSLVQMRRQVD